MSVPDEAEFNYQWKNLPSRSIEYKADRIKEFLELTGFRKPSVFSSRSSDIAGKLCMDAGCGNGRYTYAMLKLGAKKVDGIDISPEAIAKCREINSSCQVRSILDLQPDPSYDFVLCWGVLNHIAEPRQGFSNVASQVKPNGILHVMVYHKDMQTAYEEGRRLWPSMSLDEKLNYCEIMIAKHGGDLHGWFDACNPKYNWSFTEDQVRKWFEEEGFVNIALINKYNINMQGTKR